MEEENTKLIVLINYYPDQWGKIKPLLEQLLDQSERKSIKNLMQEIFEAMNGKKANFISLFEPDFDKNALIQVVQHNAKWALMVDEFFPDGTLFALEQGKPAYVEYSAEQIECIINHGFFCIVPQQDPDLDMPSLINFTTWHTNGYELFVEKLKFYFEYSLKNIESGENLAGRKLSFERKVLSKDEILQHNQDFFENCDTKLSDVTLHSQGLIEDREDNLMIDFANMYIGGGCMHSGWVQEEILFLIYPELIFSLMILPPMLDNEAIIITGAKRYANYKGYALSTKFVKRIEDDSQELDTLGRIKRTFSAIDAICFFDPQSQLEQFQPNYIIRELHKSIIGFKGDKNESAQSHSSLIPISTGKWGCGAFNGNPELKFVIQWISASLCNRPMLFHTLDHPDSKHLEEIYAHYEGKDVKSLFGDIIAVERSLKTEVGKYPVYEYIKSNIE